MPRRSTGRSDAPADAQAPMLGVLSVLLLLIPSLVLMAQITRYAQISVSSPRYSTKGTEPHVIDCGRGRSFEVSITHEGFFTLNDHGQWSRVGAPVDGLDHDALAAVVREHKRAYPHETVAVVSAEPDIPYSTVVATLDTVRGSGCALASAFAGEELPPECMLWNPIIRDRTPNRDIPAFRRDQTWPPTPDHEVSIAEGTAPRGGLRGRARRVIPRAHRRVVARRHRSPA